MNSTNPELSWKPVKKGRRSKKSVARSFSSSVKGGNSISPEIVGDFSGSDSDKFGDIITGRKTSVKSENVPLKKRSHLLQSPSPHTWESSLRNQDPAPSKALSSFPLLDDGIQPQNCSCSSGDFFGIQLLAAAASMDQHFDDADKKDTLPEDSSIPKNSDESSSATLSEQCLKNDELVVSLNNINAPGANVDSQENTSATASQIISASPEDDTVLKVNRKHWDLNTLMDAWGEPCDDSNAGDTLKNDNGTRHLNEMEEHFGDHVPSNQNASIDVKPSLKVEEDKSTTAEEDGMCSELPQPNNSLLEPPASIYCHPGSDTSNQACEKDPDDENLIKALNCDADLKRLNQVTFDATIGSSASSKLFCSSGMLKPEETNNCTVAMIQDGDCFSNMTECDKTAALDGSDMQTDEDNAGDTAVSESVIDVKPDDLKVPLNSLSPGTCTLDAEPVASTDSNKQIDGGFPSNSAVADRKQYSDTKHDEDSLPSNRKLKRTTLVDTCMSFSARAHCDEPTTVGGAGFALDGLHSPDLSQDNHFDMINGNDLTGFQNGYDSPYEDGELRGSFLYSWEDNEMENECVDYESDGRNGDGSDVADYFGSEIVEGGSEGSNGSQRSLSLKTSAEVESKSGAVKQALKKHVFKAESNNNEIAAKGSNAGSGSTVEQCMEMPMEENERAKRLEQLDHKNAVNFSVTRVNEYASKAVKGKLQSRIEGRSPTDATGGKDVFFEPQSRSSGFAVSYPRPERDISTDRYLGRYRSGAPDERDGVNQWTSWGSRRRYNTSYRGVEGHTNTRPRNKTGESTSKIDVVDYPEIRQTSYMSKGLHRPFVRRSPGEDYFDVGRRIPVTRGVGKYRSRGHYSQHHGRDFVEDFESLPDDAGASVRMPHYISRRERSFSPGSGRQKRMSLPRRRSRSRSVTCSPPRAWQSSQRERICGARRLSRSPDFRSEARMERMRMPFSKPSFASDYGDGYVSPSRGRFSLQRNSRWVEDRNFADNHLRRRRSPVGVFRRTQRFDGVGSSGRLKPDEYFRPVIRSGRFTESNYDRRRSGGGEMSHRVAHDTGNMKRFRHNTVGDDFETKNMTNEEDIRVGDDKKAFKI